METQNISFDDVRSMDKIGSFCRFLCIVNAIGIQGLDT